MGAAHSYIKRVFCATGFCGTHHDLRSGKPSNSSRKTVTKKVIHKSATPPSAGAKMSVGDNRVGVMLEYSDIMKLRILDFPEGNARFEVNGCKSTPTRNFIFRRRMSISSRKPEASGLTLKACSWEDCVSILSHDKDREVRFSRRRSPITIATVGRYRSRKKSALEAVPNEE